MLEVEVREGLARSVAWEPEKGKALRTPAVLFLAAGRSPGFKHAEGAVLAKGCAALDIGPEAPVLVDGDGNDADIPTAMSCPSYLADLMEEGPPFLGKDGRAMVVGPRPPENVPDPVEVVVAGNIAGLLEDPKRLVPYMTGLRKAIGASRLIYTPNVGEPAHMAMLTYLGVDLFGSIPLLTAARRSLLLFPDGGHKADDVWGKGLCNCPACSSGAGEVFDRALMHNQHAALMESRRVRHALDTSMLRELVEARVRVAPWLVAALRELDLRHYDAVEAGLPVSKPFLIACSRESLHRPEVVRFQRRFREWYARPPSAKVLLLLPCSARKPYSSSPTHRAISAAVGECKASWMVHKVVLTSPLGVVPMDLELFYPANTYDITVTGDWDSPEVRMIQEGLDHLLRTGRYEAVVSYIGGMPFVADLLQDHRRALALRPEDPRKKEDLQNLTSALDGMLEAVGTGSGKDGPALGRLAQDIGSFARFQFGPGGEALVDKVQRLRESYRLFKDGKMTGTLNESRGLVSLTMDGGEIVKGLGRHVVEIEDFEPKGTVFAVGVRNASKDIRPGDDVVVVRGGEVAGVGVAMMGGPEMMEKRAGRRGAAVDLRHRRGSK